MKYAECLSSGRKSEGPSLLEDGSTREVVADECRNAALDFMAGVADGWSKFDLALWLHGPYALAARHSPVGDRLPASKVARRTLEGKTIEELIVGVRGQLVASLERAALGNGAPDFIEHALIEQHVRRAVDEHSESTWVPVDAARMRLRDRIASLFVADYLNRPAAYKHLYVCHLCESVTFEVGAKERGLCGAHRMTSQVVPRYEAKPFPLERRLARPVRTLAYGE